MATATKTAPPVAPATNGAEAPVVAIKLTRIKFVTLQVPIRGLTPVIVNRWSEKAKRLMLANMQTTGAKIKAPREPKNPEKEAHDSCYWMPDGSAGFPAVGFKGAIIGAVRLFEGLTLVSTKVMIDVIGEAVTAADGLLDLVVPLVGPTQMREDMPRNATGVADLRYRTQVWPWSAELFVTYPEGHIDADSVVSLVDAAGRGGIGDWRPSSPKALTGIYGKWEVVL